MASKHFARHLRIAWLVGPKQADHLHSGEEEKGAECDQRDKIGRAPCPLGERPVVIELVGGQCDNYCTLSGWLRLS